MMVSVFTDIIQIIVFPTCANALLGVACPSEFTQFGFRVHGPQEDWLELVHTGVCEQERGVIVRNNGTGFVKDVVLLFEEINERVSDSLRRPFNLHLTWHRRRRSGNMSNECWIPERRRQRCREWVKRVY
jgi:hypothetical protein